MKQKLSFLLLMLFCSIGITFGQELNIQGNVSDASSKEAITGARIQIKGTSNGTISDIEGNYTIKNVKANDILVVSYLGMKTLEVPVNGRSTINFALTSETSQLDEIVVVGYGTSKKADLTAAITTIKSEDFQNVPTSNAMGALQGKVSGVQITNSGVPGASPTVRLRGVGTFDSSKEGPLYVVDGMFFDNIDFLDNNNIESITVLKDASAAAIYGVRAANGVILVTTRNSVKGESHITYDGYVGIQQANHVLKLTNAAQYAELMKEAGQTSNIESSINKWGGSNGIPSTDTDWYKEILRTGIVTNHSLNITGAGEKGSYLVGTSYFNQKGIMDAESNYHRYNIITKGDYQPFSWLKVGANVNISNSKQLQPSLEAFRAAFIAPPIFPVYDDNNTNAFPVKYGSPGDIGLVNGYYQNPVARGHYGNIELNTVRVLPSFYAEVSLIPKHLTYKFSVAQDYNLVNTSDYMERYFVYSEQKSLNSILTKTRDFYLNTIIDNLLTYTNQFGKQNLTAVLGQSSRSESYQMLQGYVKDLKGDGSEQYRYISLGDADTRKGTDNGARYRGLSFFGRVNYDYANRYLASLTFRADGSSKYQEKWGYFPSIGLGWVISEEPFMKDQHVFDFLKLRASWGKLGNDKVEASDGFAGIDNSWYVSMNKQLYPGLVLKDYFSWLRWEVVDETNVGLQFNILKNRLSADINYYDRLTKNAVVTNTLAITGETVKANSGEIRNSGLEFDLNWRDRIGDFNYQIAFNATTLKNHVTKIQSGLDYLLTGVAEFRQIMKVGYPMNSYYGYKVVGIYQNDAEVAADPIAVANGYKPGYLKYEDVNGDKVLDNNDRQVLGDPYPSFTYGVNIGAQYKNFDFSLSTYGVSGVELMNVKDAQRMYASNMNFTKKFYDDHWSTAHPSTGTPSVEGLQRAANGNLSSYFVQNGNYFQIQNVQLGYTVKKMFNLFDARFYVSADQPFTFFSYNGYTPQVSSGYDSTTYPLAATYSFGLRFTY